MGLQLEILNHSKKRVISAVLVRKATQLIFKELKKKKLIDTSVAHYLTIVFVTKQQIQNLNKNFRKKNQPTDVLSFSYGDGLSGDLILCPQCIRNKWIHSGLSYRESHLYLIVHGMLHLLGFDHEESKKQAEQMYALQDDIFCSIQDQLNSITRSW